VLAGDDNNAFLAQAQQYQLPAKVEMLTEQIELVALRAVGDASVGLVGSSRYAFTFDNPQNREFVELWKKEHGGALPDTFEGETWQAMQVIQQGIETAKGTDTAPLREALKKVELTSVKGKIKMRECDHQAVQPGFMVRVVKKEGYAHPIPEVIATFPGERTTPGCRKMTYDN
jgi:branched-chain amino acid transport system substrate-binding protein